VRWRLLPGLALGGLALAVAPAEPSGSSSQTSRELPLLTIAELGTLSWTCDTRGGPHAVWFRASPSKATEVVRIASGGTQRTLKLQPGGALSLRVGEDQRVRVTIAQATEPRTLRAVISLTFSGQGSLSYCRPYFPPAVSLSLHD
jgi:hypothetical protein